MIYPKSKQPTLSPELFRAPTNEYRGAPFWAWNCKLDKEELLRQTEVLGKMGFGGYHMHVRSGMATTYLSDEFMELISACVQKAKETGMFAYLYDEDRWPSGAAGGLVTKDPSTRMKILVFSKFDAEEAVRLKKTFVYSDSASTPFSADAKLLARYDITLNADGRMTAYRRLAEGEVAKDREWFAYLQAAGTHTWYNNQAYVDTLSKTAIDRFIEITYTAYKNKVGAEFGKSVPSIFTDEPQFAHKKTLPFAESEDAVPLPWTTDLTDTYRAAYGDDILDTLPELLWEKADGLPSVARYRFQDHVCERFTEAFADNCGKWCRAHGLAFTGHIYGEPLLMKQTMSNGEVMRAYRAFDIPGIDMLSDRHEYNTAKQTQSAVHQFGKEGMMSELYGVTGWDFDFRRHKTYGDWQAALGVTLRVPHLSWVSMRGEAKRDYPASINYQSSWWQEYSYIENHFARLATALTRGKPSVRVAVIHPIESYWLHWGPANQTAGIREQREKQFEDLTKWLLFGGIDFDFIAESLLPTLNKEGSAPLAVGEMAYDVVIVPDCETLRSTTVERLEGFAAGGGKLIFMGNAPKYEDAAPSARPAALCERAEQIPFAKTAILDALYDYRALEIHTTDGAYSDDLLHQIREDGEGKWLFIAKGKEPYNQDVCRAQSIIVTLRGLYSVELYDTLTGDIKPIASTQNGKNTLLHFTLQSHDSLLLRLTPHIGDITVEQASVTAPVRLRIPAESTFVTEDPNALLLDFAEYALDDGDLAPAEEILRVDTAIRLALDYSAGGGKPCQPWVFPEVAPTHTAKLRYTFESKIPVTGAKLAAELTEGSVIRLDDENVAFAPDGYYVDKSILTFPLPAFSEGLHTLELEIPYGERSALERCYILGGFGVRLSGRVARIVALPERLGYNDITRQDLPFFSGKLTYQIKVTAPEDGLYRFRVPQYRACAVLVSVDGGEPMQLSLAPYSADLALTEGEHTLELVLHISRNNGFGPLHHSDRACPYVSPKYWRTKGDDEFSEEYWLTEQGLLSSPAFYKL